MTDRMVLDLADPEELTLVARGIPFPAGILHRWLPARTRRDHRYRFFKRDRSMRRALPVRAWDTPAVPIDRGQLEEVTGRMLPVSGILHLLEEEAQILDVARADDDADVIAEVFDNDILELTRRALQRVMLMQGEAVSTGKVTIGTQAAPENGLQLPAVDFGVPAGNIFTASTLIDAVSPDVLGLFGDIKQTFTTGTGGEVKPGVFVLSSRILNVLLRDADLRNLLGSLLGAPPSIGVNQLNTLMSDRQLPRIIVDDTAVPDHNNVMTRQIPDNVIVVLPEDPETQGGSPIGATQWGLTEEAKKLVRAEVLDNALAPGLVAVPMESDNPVRTGTLVAGIALPVITEPDLVMAVTVLAD